MTREEAIEIVNKGKCPYPVSLKEKEKNEAFDMAISTLSTEGEYIKKEDTIEYLNDLFGEMCHVSFGNVLQSIDSLPTYSFPNSAEIKGFDGMTNGEVIQAVLGLKNEQIDVGTYSVYLYSIGLVGCKPFATISRDWWNAPYKAESEGTE